MVKRLALIALCCALLAGCTGPGGAYVPTGDALYQPTTALPIQTDPEREQEMVMVYYPDKSMNPYTATDFTNRALFPLVYQGLFSVDADYQATPVLCNGYSVNKDMTVHTFYLEKATFSDGTALTAEDVVRSLLAAKAGTVYSGRFRQIKSILAADDGGVVITTTTPYENLPILLDVPIVRADQVEEAQPLGTGPYYYATGFSGLRLCRRDNWWCRANLSVTASNITLRQATSPSQIRDQFQFEDVTLVCADPGSDTYADYRCDFELWDCENGIFVYLGCNSESIVFSNPAVRAALTHAINRDALTEQYYGGFARAAVLPASPKSPYYSTLLAGHYGYAEGTLRSAVESAGMTDWSITLLVNSDDTMRVRTARAIAAQLRLEGLNVKLSELGGSSYRSALKKGEYDLYLGQTKLSPNMDLSAFFSSKGALSYGGMDDASLLTLCWDALANEGNYYTLHQKVMEDGRLVPVLFRSYAVYARRGLLSELNPSRDNLFFYSIGKTMDSIRADAAGTT